MVPEPKHPRIGMEYFCREGGDLWSMPKTGVVEVAAMNQRLKMLGHDAAKELNEKIIQMLTDKK